MYHQNDIRYTETYIYRIKLFECFLQDLQEFVDGSGEAGFIFVSFGSIVPAQMMPKHAKKALFEAFSKIAQRVVWRFENLDNWQIPPNIKLVKWVPQVTILGKTNNLYFNDRMSF